MFCLISIPVETLEKNYYMIFTLFILRLNSILQK